eukprot:662772-Amphidinium_carterae.1
MFVPKGGLSKCTAQHSVWCHVPLLQWQRTAAQTLCRQTVAVVDGKSVPDQRDARTNVRKIAQQCIANVCAEFFDANWTPIARRKAIVWICDLPQPAFLDPWLKVAGLRVPSPHQQQMQHM